MAKIEVTTTPERGAAMLQLEVCDVTRLRAVQRILNAPQGEWPIEINDDDTVTIETPDIRPIERLIDGRPVDPGVHELRLSTRSYNQLTKAGLRRYEDIVRHITEYAHKGRSVKLDNLGAKSYDEIFGELAVHLCARFGEPLDFEHFQRAWGWDERDLRAAHSRFPGVIKEVNKQAKAPHDPFITWGQALEAVAKSREEIHKRTAEFSKSFGWKEATELAEKEALVRVLFRKPGITELDAYLTAATFSYAWKQEGEHQITLEIQAKGE